METKRLILSMAIMLALVAGWKLTIEYLYKKYPTLAQQSQQPTTEPSTAPTAGVDATQPANLAAGFNGISTTNPSASAIAGSMVGLHVLPAPATQPIQTEEIGSATHKDPVYALGLAVDPNGAGLSSVTLNDYFETADQKELYVFQRPLPGFENQSRPLGTRSVVVNGSTVDLSKVAWERTSVDSSSATFTATIANNGEPVLAITKTFTVQPRASSDGSKGFEIRVAQDFKNLSPAPLKVKTTFNGTTAPERENDRTEDRQFIAGFDDERYVTVSHAFLGELTKDKPTKDLAQLQRLPLLWVGSGSSYFNAIVRPEYAGQTAPAPARFDSADASLLNPDAPVEFHESSVAIESNEFTVAPGTDAPLNLRVFFGPKQRSLLKNDYYSRYPLSYGETLVYSSGMCGFLTFQWLINALYGILWFFHAIFQDWGIAIICLVCLVRLALHPITKKSQVNMMQMSKMGPEIERLKKKHGDNKDELNKAMMQFYKTQGFTPVLGCLPMFLQMPIWIALWSALQSTFDLRQAGFLRFGWLHLTWIKDLSHPDFLRHFETPVPLFLFGWTLHGINVLPLLLAVVFFVQQKFQPVPANQTPEQEQQRKMMQWMTLLFPIMLYSGPSGLNLYILTSTTIGIIESKIIRDHIKQRDEAEKAGRVFVDAKPTRASKRKDKEPAKPEKQSGVMGWIADLQAKAEEVRREAERRGKDRA